jgi:uncharacterized protein YyaL (SSP411 family)
MERESFESTATAELMNASFVCIKVDREERPDIDDIYMRAVQMMTGRGGWPLTAFLTPELKPFYGGTYFPPDDRHGMPAFRSVLQGVASAYRERRGEVETMADDLRDQIAVRPPSGGSAELLTHDLVYRGAMELHDRFDPNDGGFGGAPKFPHSTSISLLLRYAHHHNDAELQGEATFTLDRMAAGGIFDQLAGGFHRYSVDAQWLVPHFEKMLYDNALLVTPYLEAWQQTREPELERAVRETLDWVCAEMQSEAGGYFSTLDADSEGVEGKYYVWSQQEIREVLGEAAERFESIYGVTASGNWEGSNILNLPRSIVSCADAAGVDVASLHELLVESRRLLLERRSARIRPALDDKVLADWNGLMIIAMAQAGRVLDEPRYVESAARAARFVLDHMMQGDRLLHTWREGRAHLLAYLDDYAAMVGGCTELFLTTGEWRWLRAARQLADGMILLFWDEADNGFFFTGSDHEELLARLKSAHDGATPAGNALAITWLQRLATLLDEPRYDQHARLTLYAFAPQLRRMPSAFGQLLLALDDHLAEPRETVVIGKRDDPATREALTRLWQQYAPHDLVVPFDPQGEDAALLADLPVVAGKPELAADEGPTFFVCQRYACEAPTRDLEAVLERRSDPQR